MKITIESKDTETEGEFITEETIIAPIDEALKAQFSLLYERSRKADVSTGELAMITNSMVSLAKLIQEIQDTHSN